MNLPFRVLQVLTIMNRGGAETMIMNYYRNMDRSKVQFDFLLHREERGAFDDEIESLGGKIYRMPPISPNNAFKYRAKLKEFFKTHHYSVVHSHLNGLSYYVLKAAKQAGTKTRVAHSHIAIEPITIGSFFAPNKRLVFTIKDCIQNLLKKKVLKVATNYFACGTSAGKWLFGEHEMDKVNVINNAIDSSNFVFNSDKAQEIKKDLNLENKRIIGHVGRFDDQKNHFFLIDIFNEIHNKNSEIDLVLIGEGHLKNQVIEKVKKYKLEKNVHFLGVRNDVHELLNGMDIILFPSLYEGLPVSLIEAQASGLRILTSNTVTSKINVTGLVHFRSLDDSAVEWANLLLNLIDYKRENMKKKIIEANYDIKSNALVLQKFYLDNLE
ncbi:glycosyltransferase family 1 protein [Hyunsoonleella ulvae]|uniref:glycosyltransferase family 1 protein n=1 Tax=Hyunsoonleella ulvae TaxID=2799948 RepID=UPI00193A7B60|nr:glycosyltransferase family 1 protein [Hyunsoonleella ulvae]